MKFEEWYNKNYKKLLVIPAGLFILSSIFIGFFILKTGDVINKDVTLTGGSTLTIATDIPPSVVKPKLKDYVKDFSIRAISDNTGKQIELIVIVKEEDTQKAIDALEKILGFKLTNENFSKETTSASLSEDFYKQLVIAVILAFFWMSAVVFIIFAKGGKLKFRVVLLNILLGFFMGNFFFSLNYLLSLAIFLVFAVLLIRIYIKKSVPSFAVMLSAFGDILMTLAIVDVIGMKISTGGIVAFLMLIGYSVDTDILLTTRVLTRKDSVNKALYGAFKTGTTMTLTSMAAIAAALFVVYNFQSVLNQIFSILLIGLGLDLINTWVTNATIIKWYVEAKEK